MGKEPIYESEEEVEENGSADLSSDLDKAMVENRDHMWVDSILINFTEDMTVGIPDENEESGIRNISRRISMGITAKSDNRTPIKILHNAASKSLHSVFETEKEKWLNEVAIKAEVKKIQKKVLAETTIPDTNTTEPEVSDDNTEPEAF